MSAYPKAALFDLDDAQWAADEWGANCGPGAIAAVLGLTLDEVRPHMGDFEKKHYTNPTLMWSALKSLKADWRWDRDNRLWPAYGLARIQWEGPWTAEGVPMRVRYRHTHWVGCRPGQIFDINAICAGGWIAEQEWTNELVPWLLPQVEPKADGKWHITHSVEVRLR